MAKILWADDEIDLLKPHILLLRKKGYDVTTVASGPDALDALDAEDFDIVFLDEMMPGLSGLETLNRINLSHPDVPVVMITKSEEEDIMNQAIGNKIADYLIKPVNPAQILLSLKKNLQSARLVSEHTNSGYQQDFARLSMLINDARSIEDWYEIYRQLVYWEINLSEGDNAMAEMILMQKREANSNFSKFIPRVYEDWIQTQEHPLMSHELFKKCIFPLRDEGQKVALIVIDNFRLDQWRAIQPLLADDFVAREELYTAILPTTTQFARNSIFAGLLPLKIKEMFPSLWVDNSSDEESLNDHESELIASQLERYRRKDTFVYNKVRTSEQIEHQIRALGSSARKDIFVLVVNFIDMLSHSGTESRMMRELAGTDAAYRSLTESWFRHSPILDLFRQLAHFGYKIILTTDHGTIRVDNPVKIVGTRDLNTNLRYKAGRNLSYNARQVFSLTNPAKCGLPVPSLSSEYVFTTNNDFFTYPNRYNEFVKLYTGTFQHGGISLEEMLIPLVTLTPRQQ
ncbi:MAG: bifunctional response regulator/alkaline phosphatase family protein [Bacteroidales bacterium]|nr:bifunctional response regulator/alkaline phosphatase family protein [Bacteroidales bacterium]